MRQPPEWFQCQALLPQTALSDRELNSFARGIDSELTGEHRKSTTATPDNLRCKYAKTSEERRSSRSERRRVRKRILPSEPAFSVAFLRPIRRAIPQLMIRSELAHDIYRQSCSRASHSAEK